MPKYSLVLFYNSNVLQCILKVRFVDDELGFALLRCLLEEPVEFLWVLMSFSREG